MVSERSRRSRATCGEHSRTKSRGESNHWFVYIVKCKNKALYTGITDNIERRIKEHNSKKGGYYTRAFGPVKLVWKEKKPNRSSAMKREIQIKRWPRVKKEALIKILFTVK